MWPRRFTEQGRGHPSVRDRGGVDQFGGSCNDNRGLDRDYDARPVGDFADSRRDFGYDRDNRNRDLQFPSASPIFQQHSDYPFFKDNLGTNVNMGGGDRFGENVSGRRGDQYEERDQGRFFNLLDNEGRFSRPDTHNKDNNRARGHSPNIGSNKTPLNRQSKGFNTRKRGGFSNKGTRNLDFQGGNRPFDNRSRPINNNNSTNRTTTVSKFGNNPRSGDSRIDNRNKQSANDRNSSKSSQGRGSDRSRAGQSSHTKTSHSQGNRSLSTGDKSLGKKSSPSCSGQLSGRDRSPRSRSSHTMDNQKKDVSKYTSQDRSPRSRSSTRYNDHRNENTKSRDTDLTDDQSFKKPKEVSRNDLPKSENSFINTSYHEDDIISIMADDEGFDRETIRSESVISVNRHRTHVGGDRQGDSRKSSNDRSNRSAQRDSTRSSRNTTDSKKVDIKSSASGRKTSHRDSDRRDTNQDKNKPRDDRTRVFASKVRRTMFGFQRSDNRQFGKTVNSNSRSKGTDRPQGGKYGYKSKLFSNSKSQSRQGNNMTKFRDGRMTSDRENVDTGLVRTIVTDGSARQEGIQIRGRSGAILQDDRATGPSNMVNDNQNNQGFTNAPTNFESNFDNQNVRYVDSRGKFDRLRFNTGKSNAVLKRESIKKRYDRVRHTIKNRIHFEQRKERQIARNFTMKEEGTNQLGKPGEGMLLNTDQPMMDGAQPIYFIPHSDMGAGQSQFIDPMGNIVGNSAMGIPGGDNLQLLPQGLPLPDGGTGDQQLVFIPFPPQMPALPENTLPPPDHSIHSNVPQATKREVHESTKPARRKPLTAHARMLIRRDLMRKKRIALEKKIEKQVLKKLMSNTTITGMKKEPSPVKKRPVIKRISPPRETSHINKKVKLVHRSAPKEVLDDVSDDYDNVSEFEDVSDMEDVSDDDIEDRYARKRRGRDQEKTPAFRKPGQPRPRNEASTSGDVRRVVNQSFRNTSGSRRLADDVHKKDVVKSEPHQKPTYARKRRSISPIEITVSNVRKQAVNQQGSNIQGQRISRFHEEEEDVNYIKSSSGPRVGGRSGGDSDVSKTRRTMVVENRRSSGKYEEEDMDHHSRDRSRERSPDKQSRRQRITQDTHRDTRSRGSQDDRYDDNDKKQRPHLVIDDFTDNRQISTNFVASQNYTLPSSQSFAGQNQSPIMIYSNSEVDYCLPPQQISHVSAPMGPTIVDVHNAQDMSMPPPMVGGPQTSMAPLMVQQQPMQNLDNSRFSRQPQQPQYRQQHVVQHQNSSPSMRIIHQGQPTPQGVMRGRQQIQHSTHAVYTDGPQNIQSSGHVKQLNSSPMMGQSQQTIQSSRSPQYVSRGPQQPSISRGRGLRSRFSPSSETQGLRNNRPLMSAVGTSSRYIGNTSETYPSHESGRYTGPGASNQYTMVADTGPGFVEEYEDDMAELLCSKCDRVFFDDQAMRKHKEWHDKVAMGDCQLRCDLCEQAFPNDAQNQIHEQEKHSVDSWNCNMCDLTFHTASVLEQHLNSVNHQSTKLLYNCSICPANFQSLKFLIQHKRDHHSWTRDVNYY